MALFYSNLFAARDCHLKLLLLSPLIGSLLVFFCGIVKELELKGREYLSET